MIVQHNRGAARCVGDSRVLRSFERVVLRGWVAWKATELEGVPRPIDEPVVSIHGLDPVECLIVGAGPASGWGVASHQISLVGGLARALSRRLERGLTMRGIIDPAVTASAVAGSLDDIRWDQADAIFLTLGMNEVLAFRSAAQWRRDLSSLLHGILDRADAPVFVIGMPPVEALPTFAGLGAPAISRRIRRLNDLSRQLCESISRVGFIPLASPGEEAAERYRSGATYTLWADAIAEATGLGPEWTPQRRRVLDEGRRAASVEKLGILDTPPEEQFDQVVRLAARVFDTAAAGFTVLHGARQWFKAISGFPVQEMHRDHSFCEFTVRQGGPLVVGDARADARFDGNPFVHSDGGVRFYAGYPLRAPDGEYIGALCVFDSKPRRAEDVDVATLRDLALMIEAGLEAAHFRSPRQPASSQPGLRG